MSDDDFYNADPKALVGRRPTGNYRSYDGALCTIARLHVSGAFRLRLGSRAFRVA